MVRKERGIDMRKWKEGAAALLVALAVISGGCGKTAVKAPEEAPLVKTMTVGAGANEESRTFSGTVHGYYESPLAFQVGGRIIARYVQSGERVAAGQPLFKIDSKDAEEQVAAAQGAVSQAEAQYRLASSTLNRYSSLHAADAISDLAMDQTRSSYEAAAASLDQAQATLSRAENNLGFTILSADRDGLVGSTMYEVGQVVAAGTPVALIVDDSKKDVYISLPEKDYGRYSVGMPVTVTFWALPGVTVSGTVREVAASPNAATGTYDAKVTLLDAPENVAVGMTASVRFDDGRPGAVYVPLTAMASQNQSPSVWVVKDGKAAIVPVKTGAYGKDSVEILSGLEKGDKVITAGGGKLTEGEEVRS